MGNEKGREVLGRPDATADRPVGRLTSGLHVKGEIIGTEDLLIEGSVEGMIQLGERKLTVAPTAKLVADINAREVVVYGYVKGTVHAKGRIEIKKNGAAIGSLITGQFAIEDGADFRGSLEIEKGSTKETEQNVSVRAASASAGAGSEAA
jgi:cytoskeletal protein CcmA (bactofilin family)